jgi:hypothetical protein
MPVSEWYFILPLTCRLLPPPARTQAHSELLNHSQLGRGRGSGVAGTEDPRGLWLSLKQRTPTSSLFEITASPLAVGREVRVAIVR